jgi:glutamate transport system substrate-binding protein
MTQWLKWRRAPLAALLVVGLAAVALVACSDSDKSGSPTAVGAKTTGTAASKTATTATPPSTPFPAGSTMAALKTKNEIVIGVKYDVPLMGLLDPLTQRVDGFDVAIGKEIGKALGIPEANIKFVEAISANRIPYLQEDKADLIISTMTINADRKTQIDFSRPYFLAGQSILVAQNNTTITSVDNLNGKNVCSAQGSTSETNIKNRAPQANLLSLTAYSLCVSSLKDGRVEAVSTDDIILAGFAASDRTLKLVGGQFTQEPYGIGIKKGKDDLVRFIDAQLAAMFSDGRWDRLYTQYLGQVGGIAPAAEARAKIPATN